MIYLDNNANTIVPEAVCVEMVKWLNKGNPSASYASANATRAMMTEFKRSIGRICAINPCCGEERDGEDTEAASRPNKWRVIFTSGASESNAMVISSTVEAWRERIGRTPHILASAVEHKSILEHLQDYAARGLMTLGLVPVDVTGRVQPGEVRSLIRPDTALICIMHANNETGAINDMPAIRAVCGKIPIHCDTVQTFGRFALRPIAMGINSFSVSCHKFNGPPGCGLLVIQQEFLNGYGLRPMIYGSQNNHLRGGTENVPGIGASKLAMEICHRSRAEKNKRVATLKQQILDGIKKSIPVTTYAEYTRARKVIPVVEIVILTPPAGALPNTILLSVVKQTPPMVCNGEMKNALEALGIIVSVGSACNTASPNASHVLNAMGADLFIRKGALRISLGDDTTEADVKKFLRGFIQVVTEQASLKSAR
jgi:cysteine desulfurase